MPTPSRVALATTLTAAALLVGACSSDEPDASGTENTEAQTTLTTTTNATGSARIAGDEFLPADTKAVCTTSSNKAMTAVVGGTDVFTGDASRSSNGSVAVSLDPDGKVVSVVFSTMSLSLVMGGTGTSATHETDGKTHRVSGTGSFSDSSGASDPEKPFDVEFSCG